MVVGQRWEGEPGDLHDERVADVERVVTHPLVFSAGRKSLERGGQVVQQRVLPDRQQVDLTNPSLTHTHRHRVVDGIGREDDRTRRVLVHPQNRDPRVGPLNGDRRNRKRDDNPTQPPGRRHKKLPNRGNRHGRVNWNM